INEQFVTEAGMIKFFGYFRGGLNMISLFILLFVGRIYSRWGLPVALMFHPFNYIIAFFAFLLRFDMFSAMYARMSTTIIRTTINVPANGVLIGLFPISYRGMIRPFLRGTVVRCALFLGSSLILISENFMHPRYLTFVALPFLFAWMAAPFVLKSQYAKILRDLISNNLLDLKKLDPVELAHIFREGKALDELKESFYSARGRDVIWYATLLKSFLGKKLDDHIMKNLDNQDEKTKIALIKMVSSGYWKTSIKKLLPYLNPNTPELTIAILKIITRTKAEVAGEVDWTKFENNPNPVVAGFAVACLFQENPWEYGPAIDALLEDTIKEKRMSGIVAAGLSGIKKYMPELMNILSEKENEDFIPDVIIALKRLETDDLNTIVIPFLTHSSENIRWAALDVLEVSDELPYTKTITMIGDENSGIGEMAKEKIKESEYQNDKLLVQFLGLPGRRLKEGLFELLETLDIKDLDIYLYAKKSIEECYGYLSMSQSIDTLPETKTRNLVKEYLIHKKDVGLENVIRVLAIGDHTGRMKTAWRGIFSPDTRQRANAIELLSDILDHRIFDAMLPLLESPTVEVALLDGNKVSKIPKYDSKGEHVYSHLLETEDWVDIVFALSLAHDSPAFLNGYDLLEKAPIVDLEPLRKNVIQKEIQMILKKKDNAGASEQKEPAEVKEISLADKILLLKEIEIFSSLNPGELAAIASVSTELDYGQDQEVIKQGNVGETVFLVIEGKVAVIKEQKEGEELMLDTISNGDSFGEMALLENEPRSATIRTLESSKFLVLHKQEFNETVMEYPRIALQICTVLSRRLRNLHIKIKQKD
ncbi:MAG: cyclic nucleotide-binding domain-containing protein, partial [Desulfobacteraceae bacterium]|nr:cyclic nucleotide-binding domain-containing protein [Desulfobacteraceae bacterium]